MGSDNQWTALGPAVIGFQTHSTNIQVGAEISGNDIGGRFKCDRGIAIEAASEKAVGIQAFSREAPGVEGVGAPGVFGVGGQRSPKVGVMGVNQGIDSSGLYGVHTRSVNIDSAVTPDIHPPMGAPGAGVYGYGEGGYGGVFESQSDPQSGFRVAQLRLVPLVNPGPLLPGIGQFGDLYVNVTGDPSEGTQTVNMYLCVSPGDGSAKNRAMWAPFQFGPAQQGGA
jgi:hypothetical protein